MAMTRSSILRVGFFAGVRIVRQPTEIIQIGGDSFRHAQHPQPVEAHELRLDLAIGPQIHDDDFAVLQPLQPIHTAAQHLHFACQAGSYLGLRLVPFGFLFTRSCIRGSQLTRARRRSPGLGAR